jgi:hypothetical protein
MVIGIKMINYCTSSMRSWSVAINWFMEGVLAWKALVSAPLLSQNILPFQRSPGGTRISCVSDTIGLVDLLVLNDERTWEYLDIINNVKNLAEAIRM